MVLVLYDKERKIMEFLAHFQLKFGYSPTLREIADGIGLKSPATIHEHIEALILKGYLRRADGVKRGIEIVDPTFAKGLIPTSEAVVEIPLMGFIAAGAPLEPHTDPNATFRIAASMISGKRPAFVLQVRGSSMIEDGIFDGDYVLIEHTQEANNGDIVIALVDNGLATLKRFYKESDGRIVLKPANASMSPIYPKEIQVQGKVVGLIRKFTSNGNGI